MVVHSERTRSLRELSSRLAVCDDCEFKRVTVGHYEKIEEGDPWVCGDCPNYASMRAVGDELWDSEEICEVLGKGPDMGTDGVVFLIKEGVTNRRIQEALGIDGEQMKEMIWNMKKGR